MNNAGKPVSVYLPKDVQDAIDKMVAAGLYESRSHFVTETLMIRIAQKEEYLTPKMALKLMYRLMVKFPVQ